jgi:hypothetical protein
MAWLAWRSSVPFLSILLALTLAPAHPRMAGFGIGAGAKVGSGELRAFSASSFSALATLRRI